MTPQGCTGDTFWCALVTPLILTPGIVWTPCVPITSKCLWTPKKVSSWHYSNPHLCSHSTMVFMWHQGVTIAPQSASFWCYPNTTVFTVYGIQGKTLKIATCLSMFLQGWLQRVVLNQGIWLNSCHQWCPPSAVLGLLLFLLYVKYIPDLVQSNLKLFGDDIKIYRAIYSISNSLLLQQGLS